MPASFSVCGGFDFRVCQLAHRQPTNRSLSEGRRSRLPRLPCPALKADRDKMTDRTQCRWPSPPRRARGDAVPARIPLGLATVCHGRCMHTRPNAQKLWTLPRDCCSSPGVCVAILDRNVYATNSVLTFHEHRGAHRGALIDTKPCCSLSKLLGALLRPWREADNKKPASAKEQCLPLLLFTCSPRSGS